MLPSREGQDSSGLIRGIGLAGATSLNMIDMIGVGPFITIPLIVAAMGGEMGVESEEGAGSCFWFRVVLAAQPTVS